MQALFGIQPPPGSNPDTVLGVHPTQLYETVLGFVMFAISSTAWIASGAIMGVRSLVTVNTVLLLTNLLGIYRWLLS